MLTALRQLADPLRFILLSCHTPGYSPLCLAALLQRVFGLASGEIESGEMVVPIAGSDHRLPSGAFARWHGPRE